MEKLNEIDDLIANYEGFIFLIFISPKCPECDGVYPKIKKISEMRNDIRIVQIDVDKNPKTIEKFSVEEIPTVIIYCKDILVDFVVGDCDVDRYLKRIIIDIKNEED